MKLIVGDLRKAGLIAHGWGRLRRPLELIFQEAGHAGVTCWRLPRVALRLCHGEAKVA